MIANLYQKNTYLGTLKLVATVNMPMDCHVINVPMRQPLNIANLKGQLDINDIIKMLTSPVSETLQYHKWPLAFDKDAYVALVNVSVLQKPTT